MFFKEDKSLNQLYKIEKSSSEIEEFIVYHQKLTSFQSYKFKKKILKEILLQIGQPDIIHLHVLAVDQLIFARYALKNKIPYFISEHWSGYVASGFKNMPKAKQHIYKRIAKRAKVILPVSRFLEKGMQSCGLKGDYSVLPNIVDLPEVISTKNKDFTFIVVSDIADDIKNISGIVKAFQDIKKNKNEIQLVIVGDGPDFEDIEKLVNTNPSGIKLLGRLANREALIEISKAHCLVVNSNIETFSVVCIEARAQGLQVIATDCGGPSEFADEFTFIIPVNDLESLKKQLLHSLEKSHIPQRDIRKFSKQQIGSSLLDLYEL